MLDAPEVMKTLSRKVTMEVPFPPVSTSWDRAARKTRKILRGRPSTWEHTFHEAPAEHVIEYVSLVAEASRAAFRLPEPNGDLFAGILQALTGAKEQVHGALRILSHITGVTDQEFLSALTPGQRDVLIEAYEAVNPSLDEFKKKLDTIFHAAVAQMASRATDEMLREHGLVRQTGSPTATAWTPTPSSAPGPSDGSGATTAPS